jgi:pimeloyl-ACP methyl ester carboxylesterase
MPYADLGDLDLYYEDLGRRDAPPLVLLHGFTVTGRVNWGGYVDAFDRDYRVVLPDLRGHGRSGNPAGATAMTMRQFARDIAGLCRWLDIDRAAFCGYSAGAVLQLPLALEEPDLVAASVLISGGSCFPEQTRAVMRAKTADQLAYEWFELPPNHPPTEVPESASWHTALGPDHWHQVLVDFLALFDHRPADDFPDLSELSRIASPTLIIHGDQDAYFPPAVANDLARRLPDAELYILPDTPHEVLDAHPALVRSLCTEFLAHRYAAVSPV